MPLDENRETAITRRSWAPSASAAARFAIRASVGPILPPAPRMTMSPGARASAAAVAGRGVEEIVEFRVAVKTTKGRARQPSN